MQKSLLGQRFPVEVCGNQEDFKESKFESVFFSGGVAASLFHETPTSINNQSNENKNLLSIINNADKHIWLQPANIKHKNIFY